MTIIKRLRYQEDFSLFFDDLKFPLGGRFRGD